MSRKIILIFIFIFFLSSFHSVFADLSINEVFYSPASKQWVEIYNDTNTDIDITQYKILDAGASVNGHSISVAVSGGSTILPAHAYGVIAKDITSVSATYLFHAALGISTSGSDTVILKNGSNVIDTVSVPLNSAINGNSLQLISGSWVSATPTPGVANDSVSTSSTSTGAVGTAGLVDSDSTNNDSSTPATDTTASKADESQIQVKITAKTLAFVGSPLSLLATAFGYNKEPLLYGKYFWNFGDGDSKEIMASDEADLAKLTHAYLYPGDYLVTLEYYLNPYSNIPDVTNQITITIIPADISISGVGDQNDFFVELTNNTDYDADISGWMLTSSAKSFTFPKNTFISSKNKIIISSSLTNFSVADENTLKLINPQGKVVYDYSAYLVSPVVVAVASLPTTEPSSGKSAVDNNSVNNNQPKVEEIPTISKIPIQNLTANATSSDIVNKDSNHSIVFSIIALIFIGASAGGVYFIRQKKNIKSGDDFDILDG